MEEVGRFRLPEALAGQGRFRAARVKAASGRAVQLN